MNAAGFCYDEVFLTHETPPWHPESPQRLVAIVERLKQDGLWDRLLHIPARKAAWEDAALVHTARYLDILKTFGTGYIDGDTYVSRHSLDAALHAAGAVMEAVERCRTKEIKRAFCAIRPPGHHAEADKAMGFCILNNVAIAARHAQRIGYDRIFIVDFDVHHGNGTQHIFDKDPSVFYFSTHQFPHYPGTGSDGERGKDAGTGFTYNVPMAPGSGDKDYLPVYQDILPSLVKRFKPHLMLVSAGYDILTEDPLASIRVSHEGIRSIVHHVLTSGDMPVVFALEGGYNLQGLGESVAITISEMLK